MPTAGPTLPPHLSNKRKADENEDQSTPSRKRSRSSSPSTSPAPKRRPIGPAPPPTDLSTLPPSAPNNDTDNTSSDDDFGPSLPPEPGSLKHSLEKQRLQHLHDAENAAAAAAAAKKPQREEWMLIPPSADGLNSSRMDPTKLKNRKFQSGKGAKAPSSSSAAGIGDTWTETPEQKRQRLEDEVLGRKKPAQLQEAGGGGDGDGEGARRQRRDGEDREAERRIREYNERVRGGALMDEGRWTGKKTGSSGQREEEDDPSKRAFDREKDMKIGGAVGYSQKRELLSKARNMGDRFAKGSYL